LATARRGEDVVTGVTDDRGGDGRGDPDALFREQRGVRIVRKIRDPVAGQTVRERPPREFGERMTHPEGATRRVEVVFGELPSLVEQVEARGQRPVEEPGLGEPDRALLRVATESELDGGFPAPAQEIALRQVRGADEAVDRGESPTDREEPGRFLFHLDVD